MIDSLRFSTLFYASLRFSTLLYASLRFSTILYDSLRFSTRLRDRPEWCLRSRPPERLWGKGKSDKDVPAARKHFGGTNGSLDHPFWDFPGLVHPEASKFPENTQKIPQNTQKKTEFYDEFYDL